MKEAARAFFSAELGRHGDALHPMAQGEQDREAIKKLLSIRPITKALDISTGTGFVARTLIGIGVNQVVGSDLSSILLTSARTRSGEGSRIRWVVCDGEHLCFHSSVFDAATCRYSFHHYPDPVSGLREVNRVLRPSGVFLLADPTPPPGDPQGWLNMVFLSVEGILSGHNRFYTVEELAQMAQEAGFQVAQNLELPLRTQLSLPGFREGFQRMPTPIRRTFEIQYHKENKSIGIKLPVTYLLLEKAKS